MNNKNFDFNWSYINILRDYLIDIDITEARLIEVRAELVRMFAQLETLEGKTYEELIDIEDELQLRLITKYGRARRTINALSDMQSTPAKFLTDYLLTPDLTINALAAMYGVHHETAKRLLNNYGQHLKDGSIKELKDQIKQFELNETARL